MAVISKGTTFATGDQVTAAKLNNLADNATFASGAVDNVSTQLSGGGIIVKDGGVSTAKLADGSVTTSKIADSNVTTGKIADSNVTTDKIADSNVTKSKIENVADNKLLGNVSGAPAAPSEVDVIDEAAGIEGNDNDTSIPTSAAVKDYVDGVAGISLTELSRTSEFGTTSSSYVNVTGVTISGSDVTADGDNTYTIAAGTYLFEASFSLAGKTPFYGSSGAPAVRFVAGSNPFALNVQQVGQANDSFIDYTVGDQVLRFTSDTSLVIQLRRYSGNSGTMRISNLSANFLRIGQ